MSKSISKNAVFKTMLNLFNIALPLIITPIILGAIKETYNGYISLFSMSNMKYLLYSLIFIPICMVINSNVENILISCAIDVICCGVVYVGILLVTHDKTFKELYNLLLKKAYSRINN